MTAHPIFQMIFAAHGMGPKPELPGPRCQCGRLIEHCEQVWCGLKSAADSKETALRASQP